MTITDKTVLTAVLCHTFSVLLTS